MAEHKRETVKKKRGKVVLASGTFDLLHLGHVKYLEEAKKAGGSNSKLIVIVARDRTVEKRKGRKPVMPEDERKALVESLKVVDEAILGRENFNIADVVDEIEPDIIAVGHDQANIEEQVRKAVAKRGLPIQVVRIGRFGKPELDSSLKIKKKVTELYKR
jgi:FAD synthetase